MNDQAATSLAKSFTPEQLHAFEALNIGPVWLPRITDADPVLNQILTSNPISNSIPIPMLILLNSDAFAQTPEPGLRLGIDALTAIASSFVGNLFAAIDIESDKIVCSCLAQDSIAKSNYINAKVLVSFGNIGNLTNAAQASDAVFKLPELSELLHLKANNQTIIKSRKSAWQTLKEIRKQILKT